MTPSFRALRSAGLGTHKFARAGDRETLGLPFGKETANVPKLVDCHFLLNWCQDLLAHETRPTHLQFRVVDVILSQGSSTKLGRK